MATEELKYTLPYDVVNHVAGSRVDIIVTYDPTAHNGGSTYNSYVVTAASGSYQTLDAQGNVIHSDTITGIAPSDSPTLGNDNAIYLDGAGNPYVDGFGLGFTINVAADSNDQAGRVNFFYGADVNGGQGYQELGSNLNDASSVQLVCFAAGTLIRTDRGDVAVEHLAVGDVVMTATGAERPIRWLGHRTVQCKALADPRAVWPIRIAAHAFGENRPSRDLLVSPGHSLCVTVVEDMLIPAGKLLNGSTVRRSPVDAVTYWHVELDRHDILLANGLPAESYLAMGNRRFFANSDAVDLHALPDRSALTHDAFCRPFVEAGPLLDVVRLQLEARARRMGWQEDRSVDMHCVVDGDRVEGVQLGETAVFLFAATAVDVRLCSNVFLPDDIDGRGDRRSLGLCLQGLSVRGRGSDSRPVSLDDPRLGEGMHGPEDEGTRLIRWTTGEAVLPAALWTGLGGTIALYVDVDLGAIRSWAALATPAASDVQDASRRSVAQRRPHNVGDGPGHVVGGAPGASGRSTGVLVSDRRATR